MIIGSQKLGKSFSRHGLGLRNLLLTQAIQNVRKDSFVNSNLLVVYLNGLVHTDDRSALRAMAQQVHRQSSLLQSQLDDESANEDQLLPPVDEQQPISLTFSQQLRCFLDSLQVDGSLEKRCTRSLLIVLYEFDLFALHHNQILLYNLFDCCQNSHIPICVVGVTCRLDIMELLEKRVKSRFSHRQIHLLSIAAPKPGTGKSDSSPGAFDRYQEACQHLLSLPTALRSEEKQSSPTDSRDRRHRPNFEATVVAWNRHVAELMTDEIVVDTLRQAWSISVGLDHLLVLLIPIVAKLGADKQRIDPIEFIDSLCALRQDSKVNSLKGLSVLELFIITTLVKLQDGRDDQLVNLELLYSEYARFCRTNCPGYLYEKAVVNKALDNLIGFELVVAGRTAVAAASASSRTVTQPPRGGRVQASGGQLANYRPLFCFVDQPVLSACLDGYSNCPVELSHWVHSKMF